MIDICGNRRSLTVGQEVVGSFDADVVRYSDARVCSSDGFIIAGCRLVKETYWTEDHRKEFVSGLFWHPYRLLSGKWLNHAISLPLYWSWGYYHWICDVLPRLWLLRNLDLSEYLYLVPYPFKDWMRSSLAMLGIPEKQCVPLAGKLAYKVHNLLFPQPLAMTGDHDTSAVEWLRDKFSTRCGLASRPKNLRLYISRRFAGCRRVTNETDLFRVLARYGFQMIHSENLSFEEQIDLFSRAEHIVGPHGAGLTNMLFASESCHVIELFEPTIVRRCYRELARACGIKHQCMILHSVMNGTKDPDMVIGCEMLATLDSYFK